MQAPVRVLLVGYGYSGRTFHAPLITATPGLELAAICVRHTETVHEDLPDVRVVSSLDEGLSMPDLDLVIVATPNETHATFATAALDAGRHVVVEKPFTLDIAEGRALVRLAQAKARLLAVFHNRRWDSDFLAARALVAGGALGDVSLVESHYDRYRPQVRDRWRERPGPGAGLWCDLGPHLVDQALQLFGLPAAIAASFARQRPGSAVDDWAHVVLEYGRLRVVLNASLLVAGGVPRFAIHGAAGSWIKYGMDVQEKQLGAGLTPDQDGWGEDTMPATWYDGASSEATPMAVPHGDYRQFYLRVRDAIHGEGENPVPPIQALAVVAVVEAAARAAAEGRAVPVPMTEDEQVAFASGRSR